MAVETDEMDIVEILAEEDDPSTIEFVLATVETYGWYLLFVGIALAYAYVKYAAPRIATYKRKKDEEEYSAKYHKDPDAITARLAAQTAYARRLQEKHDRDAEEYKRKIEEKEIRKREEWLAKQEGVAGGSKLGSNPASKSFKPEYNPLAGDSSRGYRATKKSPCGGGGCG